MGLIGRIIAGGAARQIGEAVGGVAEVFVGNRAARDAAGHERTMAAIEQLGGEFAAAGSTWFDGFVDGLNRLPRPMLALGTLALFIYAMTAPAGFALRMEGLALVPEPLWWLLGAIVSFYFGARELHHIRANARPAVPQRPASPTRPATLAAPVAPAARTLASDPDHNAAVEEWRQLNG